METNEQTVELLRHTISTLRLACPDHGEWHLDGWTLYARLALSRIASGREQTSSERMQLSSHNCVWDKNPITCRIQNGVQTVLPHRPDGYTWTLDSSRTLKCGRTICHYVRTDANLNILKFLGTDGRPNGITTLSRRMLLTDESPNTSLDHPDGNMGSDFSELKSAQNLPWTLK